MNKLFFDIRNFADRRFLIVTQNGQLCLLDVIAPGQDPIENLRLKKLLSRLKKPVRLVRCCQQTKYFGDWLDEYFQGRKTKMDAQKVAWQNVSPFARRVYAQLVKTHRGELLTYQALAAKVGQPRAARAVGNALSNNPFLLLVPCHRVTHANLTQVGSYRGGIKMKHFLWQLERDFAASRAV
ncbi:MGMT family protein [Mycoplasma sp. ATU-Cv-703]|uniref:methylated-DNA--[protein]-cysteine S-methyltransferase n=1 Tax=Mycoplasma sp. ATU-Cv-703 TaxID=2498595 RepID=UPI000FDCDF77